MAAGECEMRAIARRPEWVFGTPVLPSALMVLLGWPRRLARRLAPALVLFLTPVACGGSTTAPAAAPAPTAAAAPAAPKTVAAPVSQGFFHEVESDTATVYLLGSVHLSKGDVFPMDDPIEAAFAKADTLVLELDLSEQGQLSAATQTLKQGLYPAGKTLETELDPETLELLRQRLEERGIPFAAMNRLKPWVVAITLTVLELQKNGYDPEGGIDLHFARRAEGKKKIVGLETAADQLALFSGMTPGEQALMLRQTLETLDEDAGQLDEAMAAWKASNEADLEAALLDEMKNDPKYDKLYDAMFVKRNVAMTEKLETMLRGAGTLFVVVGCGHLIGPDGIVARLRAAGYAVTQR